ncbi:MAG TPA: CTP synthase [Candidatus Magasanikbacteria bacterium]|nr:CTP synthase [Candidatus Magasanikbacteria bacterium]
MAKTKRKFIFVVGGVMSGVGKGVTSASIGMILKMKGFRVTSLKADPYVNVDAGTMNPVEHGEVFVTDDGDETDQDMGNYERFLGTNLTSENYMTTGRVYQTVIANERAMKYKGKCVQVVPHIPEEITRRIRHAAEKHDAEFTIVEIGGTVGEYENILFLEAARMMKLKDPASVMFVLVSYLPIPGHLGEMKTKPTQHAARELNSVGINPDFIVARGTHYLDAPRREKLAVFCGVEPENCISAPDVSSIYEVPLVYQEQEFGKKLLNRFGMKNVATNITDWAKFVKKLSNPKKEVRIAVIGKYFGTGNYTLADSYISVIESVKYAAWWNDAKPILEWIDSEEYEKNPKKITELAKYDGIIVPGGFGTRGVEGIMMAIKYARETRKPYFGLCYGMQLASIEFVRNVLGKKEAHTVEVNSNTPDPVIFVNPTQMTNIRENRYGGTMRLGAYDCSLMRGTIARAAYGEEKISERHRHRYEFNNAYREACEANGLKISGVNPEANLVEIVELENHPFFVGVQFHPEFKSRPMRPHPLFREFVKAALKLKEKR